MNWLVLDRITDIQVIPRNDLIAHEFFDCACGPLVEDTLNEDGQVVVSMIVHHSLDGRELSE